MSLLLRGAVAATAILAAGPAISGVVFSNDPAPGDSVTNPGGPDLNVAIGASGWGYTSVRADTEVGITDSNPRSGNGSVEFETTSGTGKADITYRPGGALGLLADLQGMSYDWFRNSSSTNPGAQHPSLRVLLDADGDLNTGTDQGGLVFEIAYNGSPVAPTDAWQTNAVDATTTHLWNYGLGLPFADGGYNQTLLDWKSKLPNAVIVGFNSGVGSGWNGMFSGNVDNISWTIGNTITTTNFEVGAAPVPLPAAIWLLGAAFAGLAAVRRKAS